MSEPPAPDDNGSRPQGRLSRFVANVLERDGALVERIGAGSIEAIVPPALCRELSLEELVTFSESAEEGTEGTSCGYGTELLGRIARHAVARGGAVALEAEISSVPLKAPEDYHGINVALRPKRASEAMGSTLVGVFRHRASCDDQREGVLRVAASVEGEVRLDLPVLKHLQLAPADPPSMPVRATDGAVRALLHAARKRALEDLRPFREIVARRHRRDAVRLLQYFTDFERDLRKRLGRRRAAPGLKMKLEGIPEEHRRRRAQLAAQYRIRVQIDPIGLIAIRCRGAGARITVRRRKRTREIVARWNGLLRAWEPLRCAGCAEPTFSFALCDAAEHVLCARCWEACGSGGRRPCFRCAGEPVREEGSGGTGESAVEASWEAVLEEAGDRGGGEPPPEPCAPEAPAPLARVPVPAARDLEELTERVRTLLREADRPLLSAEISAEVGTDAATLRAVLKPWIDSGEVERTGQRRGTRYSRRGGGGEQSDTPPDGPTGRQGELF